MPENRVLVVGTTPDYIAYLYQHYGDRVLFLTDPAQRIGSKEKAPKGALEIVCNLSDFDKVSDVLKNHLENNHQSLSGVACYDCERLVLASRIAQHWRLAFPSVRSVQNCRNKYLSKQLWTKQGVLCPRTEYIQTGPQAVRFLEQVGRPIVLKPLSGSGSELTFRCDDAYGALMAMRTILAGLAQRSNLPMYKPETGDADGADPRDTVLAEEYVEGREYSCDFVVDGDKVTVIRVAKKLRRKGMPFGTTLAYVLPARIPGALDEGHLKTKLLEAAQALDLTRAICMVDFMVSQDRIVFLELTPRNGGDCLPPLIRQSCGMDMLGMVLDFAEGRNLEIPSLGRWEELVGLRLFAQQGGIIKNMGVEKLSEDARVREVMLKRSTGHHITLPPEDYDSWLLGHVIFRADAGKSLLEQCEKLNSKLVVDLESKYDEKLTGVHSPGRGATQSSDPAPR